MAFLEPMAGSSISRASAPGHCTIISLSMCYFLSITVLSSDTRTQQPIELVPPDSGSPAMEVQQAPKQIALYYLCSTLPHLCQMKLLYWNCLPLFWVTTKSTRIQWKGLQPPWVPKLNWSRIIHTYWWILFILLDLLGWLCSLMRLRAHHNSLADSFSFYCIKNREEVLGTFSGTRIFLFTSSLRFFGGNSCEWEGEARVL